MNTSSSFDFLEDDQKQKSVGFTATGKYVVLNQRTAIFTVESLEKLESGKEIPTSQTAIRDAKFTVDLETREVIRNDGKDVEEDTKQIIRNIVGSPSIRRLRENLLASREVPVGQWFDVPNAVFDETSFKKSGFEKARYQIVNPKKQDAEWHLHVSGTIGDVRLHETLALTTLRASKGQTQGVVKKDDGKQTKLVFEAMYEIVVLDE